jgi:hypothetical protein
MKISLLVPVLIVMLLAGCATPPPRISATKSGKPEVQIKTDDVGAIKSWLIGDLVDEGYTIEKDTAYSLVMARTARGGENLAAAMSIGNGYSTNHRVVTFTFVKIGDEIRVIALNELRAQLPFGKVNTVEWNNNVTYNAYQESLNTMKAEIEGPKKPVAETVAKASEEKTP